MRKLVGRIIGFPFVVLGSLLFLVGTALLYVGYAMPLGHRESNRTLRRHLFNRPESPESPEKQAARRNGVFEGMVGDRWYQEGDRR